MAKEKEYLLTQKQFNSVYPQPLAMMVFHRPSKEKIGMVEVKTELKNVQDFLEKLIES